MSDLQIILILLGAIIIAGVIFFNWWQERKMHDSISEEFILPKKDVLVEDFYIDDAYVDQTLSDITKKTEQAGADNPPLSDEEQALTPSEELQSIKLNTGEVKEEIQPAKEHDEPEQEEAQPNDQLDDLANDYSNESVTNYPVEIHPQIDLTAMVVANDDIDVYKINQFIEKTTAKIDTSFMIHKQDQNGLWQRYDLTNDDLNACKKIACSLQLANRNGPIKKDIIDKFQLALEEFGLEIGAHVEWQKDGDAAQKASNLDAFCMEVDQLINVHLVQDSAPAHGTKLKGLAKSNGLRLNHHGQYCFFDHDDSSVPKFILINADGQPFTEENLRNTVIKKMSFQMEVPKIDDCENAFDEMITIASQMTTELGARMVDDNQRVLGDVQIDKIKQQLKTIHDTMLTRGIIPGSPHSMRLFN